MQIVFDVPHVFVPGSLAKEDGEVRHIAHSTINRINRAYSQRHPSSKPLNRLGVTQGRLMFDLPDVFHPQARATDDADTLAALLDCLIAINIRYLKYHPHTPSLYNTNVYYGRTEIWDSIPALYRRGYGDCKSLTSARIADIRIRNGLSRPVFRFNPRPNGAKDFHILVLKVNGWEDPSRILGMGSNEWAHFRKGA